MGAASHNSGICELLQKSLVRFCVENYTATSDIEIDAIICLSVVNSSQQNVIKVHEVLPKHCFRNSNTPSYVVTAAKKNVNFQMQMRKRKRQIARKKHNFKKKCEDISFQKSRGINFTEESSALNTIKNYNELKLITDDSNTVNKGHERGYENENSLTNNNVLSDRVSFDQERTCTIISLEDLSTSNTCAQANGKGVIHSNSESCSETVEDQTQPQNDTDTTDNSNGDTRNGICSYEDKINSEVQDSLNVVSEPGRKSPDVEGDNRLGIKVKQEPVSIEYVLDDYENHEPSTSRAETAPSMNSMEPTFLDRTFQSHNKPHSKESACDKSALYFESYENGMQFAQHYPDHIVKSTEMKQQQKFRNNSPNNHHYHDSQNYPVVYSNKPSQNNPNLSYFLSHNNTLDKTGGTGHFLISPEKQKNFFCEKCGTGFTCRRSLLRHMRCTCGTTMFECNICGKFYSRSDSKQRHMWKMHGVKLQNANLDPNVITVSTVSGAQGNS